MSVRTRTSLKVVPLAKAVVRASAAGEFVANLGGSDGEVQAAQQGTLKGYIKTIMIYGTSGGYSRECIRLTFDSDNDGEVMVEEDGNPPMPMLARLDRGLARLVEFQRDRLRARGLTTEVRYEFHAHVYDDPELLARVRSELGLEAAEEPDEDPDDEYDDYLTLSPEADRGSSVTMRRGWKNL